MLKAVINTRRIIQAIIGMALYMAVAQYGLPLLWVIIGGSALGIILGKIFCRWMCPLGFFMELMTSGGDKNSQMSHMYMYFKIGCPIAWIGGLFNRLSLFKVKLDKSGCISCGKCDKVCYIATHTDNHSLHKEGWTNSSVHYSCSRCMDCVSACPTGALSLSPTISTKITK